MNAKQLYVDGLVTLAWGIGLVLALLAGSLRTARTEGEGPGEQARGGEVAGVVDSRAGAVEARGAPGMALITPGRGR